MATAATIAAKLTLNSTEFNRGLDDAKKKASTFSSKLRDIGGALTRVGGMMTAGVTAPIVAGFGAAAKTAADFETQINILSVAAGDADVSLDQLSDAALAVGADTDLVGISASEAADSMTEFYKAGLTTNEIMGDMEGYLAGNAELSGAMRAAIDMAAASELDLAAASEVTTIAMSTFGLSASDATDIADNFVQAADASVASVGELADAMVNVGPTAASFGWSMETTNTALAILSERGIRGSEAGTALKSMMTNLMRPVDKVQEVLNDLNIELYDSEGAMKALPDIMADLEESLSGLSDEQRNQAIQTLAGTYGMKAMQTLLAEGSEGWAEMEDKIETAADAQESAAARTKGLNAAWEQFMGTVETLLIQVGTPLIQNFLTPLAQKATELVGWFTKLDPSVQMNIVKFLALMAAIGPVLVVVGMLISAIGSIIPVISAVVGVLSGPVLLIIAAVVAAVALLAAAWINNWGGIREKTATIVEKLKYFFAEVLPQAIGVLKTYWEDKLWPALQRVWGWIKSNLIPLLIGVGEVFITGIMTGIKAFIALWQNILWPVLKAVWSWVEANLLPILVSLGKLFGAIIFKAVEALVALFQNVLFPALSDLWTWFQDNILPILNDVWTFLKNHFQPQFDALGEVIQDVAGWISDLADSIMNLELPDWLTPGSPTPFELGLRGINQELKAMSGSSLPGLQTTLGATGTLGGAVGGSGDTSFGPGSIVMNFNGRQDEDSVRRGVSMGISDALRAKGAA